MEKKDLKRYNTKAAQPGFGKWMVFCCSSLPWEMSDKGNGNCFKGFDVGDFTFCMSLN
jgi:hypothetical protein